MALAKTLTALAALALASNPLNAADKQASPWNHYGGTEKGAQYSNLEQLNLDTVKNLKVAWMARTGELGEGSARGYSFQATPILVNETLYLSTGSGIIIALDPSSGEERWRHQPALDRSKPTSETGNRGVSSWLDPNRTETEACQHRIITGTLSGQLVAVDGRNGKPCLDFGDGGALDLSHNVGVRSETHHEYGVTSPPVIVGDTLVVGSSIGDNRGVELERGIVRGLDVRSGALRWSFDPIPKQAERAKALDWKVDEALKTGAGNAWAPLAADSELGLVYVPTGSASPDFFGGEREGDNLYTNSLVALDVNSGEVRWHQQLVHHDVWDFDLPAQPTLVELEHNGESIPAVIQATKMGLLFTFNRLTGEPIFDIEERPVPQGGVFGEHLSKTQPFPSAPPPLMNHEPITKKDAWGMAIFDRINCAKQFEKLHSQGIYTPPSLQGTLMSPAYMGGINWGGVAFDPNKQIAIVRVTEIAGVVQLIERDQLDAHKQRKEFAKSQFAQQSGTPYAMRREVLLSPIGVPCSKPPWGWVKAVDMKKGELLWEVPHGTIEDLAPSLVPNLALGVPGIGGPIATAGNLIFIAGALDNYLRAYDIRNGEEVWKARLPAGGQATPMTYSFNGKQYVVVAAGGHKGAGTKLGDYVMAFSL